jgi:hypothetical protein
MAGQGDKSRLHALASPGPRTCGVRHPDLLRTISTIAPYGFARFYAPLDRRGGHDFYQKQKTGNQTLRRCRLVVRKQLRGRQAFGRLFRSTPVSDSICPLNQHRTPRATRQSSEAPLAKSAASMQAIR